jgi:hypothetical protein
MEAKCPNSETPRVAVADEEALAIVVRLLDHFGRA